MGQRRQHAEKQTCPTCGKGIEQVRGGPRIYCSVGCRPRGCRTDNDAARRLVFRRWPEAAGDIAELVAAWERGKKP